MMAANYQLSDGLVSLLAGFEPHLDAQAVEISNESLLTIVKTIRVMLQLSIDMEQELWVHRLGEANTIARGHAEQLATETLDHLVLDTEGKVVKLDFGRRS